MGAIALRQQRDEEREAARCGIILPRLRLRGNSNTSLADASQERSCTKTTKQLTSVYLNWRLNAGSVQSQRHDSKGSCLFGSLTDRSPTERRLPTEQSLTEQSA